MVITVVTFKLNPPLTLEALTQRFQNSAPRYRDVPGLIRKHYLAAPGGGTAGGVYLWRDRKSAEQMFNDAFCSFIRETYQCEPSVEYFESPVMVDNIAGLIDTAPYADALT